MTAASPAPSDPAAPPVTHPSGGKPRKPRPSPAARRFGYVVAAAANVAIWVVIHVWPGWEEAPFLTSATEDVLPWIDAQIGAAIVVNAIWLLVDPRWLRALGEAITGAVGVAAVARVLTVFPFSFDDGVPWEQWLRFALVVALVGSAIGVLANLVALVKALRDPDDVARP